jgi:tetratricopeptide (TPR) repeat protein
MVGMAEGLARISSFVASRGWLQIVLLLALVTALLAPTLKADFLWDDFDQIVRSSTIGDFSRIPFYFTHNVVQSAGGEGRGADGVDTYRPLFMVALAAVYQINGPDPFWYHAAVLAAHLLVCTLLWNLGVRWLESRLAASLAVFFFACHPVTAEAYLWSSALPEPLAAAGLFGTILILDRRVAGRENGSAVWLAASAAALVFFAGLFAKEVVLAALPALGLFLVGRGVRLRHLLPAVVAGLGFVMIRTAALAGLQATGADWAQRMQALKVYPVLVLDGLSAMLTMQPVGIRHLSWEYAEIGWGISTAAAIVVVTLLAVVFVGRKKAPLALAAALTTCLMLLPIALVATVPGWGGFGRYLYVPLAVTALALAQLAALAHKSLAEHQPRFRWAVAATVGVALIVEMVGLQRALWVYANQENLSLAATEIFPEGPDGWEWLGNVHMDRGDLDSARECYRKATERGPQLFRPRHNLAMALYYTGHPAEALEQLEILDAQHPPTTPGSNVAVLALMEFGRWDEATARLVSAIDADQQDRTLRETAAHLVARHPDPDGLRRQLRTASLSHQSHPGVSVLLSALDAASD